MSVSGGHSFSTHRTFSAHYSLSTLTNSQSEGHKKDYEDGHFRYILTPRDPQEHKSVVSGFKLQVWFINRLEKGKGDPVTTLTCKRAEIITGKISTTWRNSTTGSLKSATGHWGCKKVVLDELEEDAEVFKLFQLWTEIPLFIEKGTDSVWDFEINLRFHLPGPLEDQVATIGRTLYSTLYTTTNPGPSSPYNNIAQNLSRPANLCLEASSRPRKEVPYVYVPQETLSLASSYLEELVEAGNNTFATRSFDGRVDFDVVDDDSDAEEDTKRHDLLEAREVARNENDDRRSEAPEPAEKKRRLEDLDETASQASTLSSLSTGNQGDSDEDGDQEMAPTRPVAGLPAAMDTRAPNEGIEVIKTPGCALSTLQAVVAFVRETPSHIVFAPLSLEGKAQRTSTIQKSIRDHPNRPIPVSPRSVYRLAERFRLDELASVALENIKGKLTSNRSGYAIAAALALHPDCVNYPQLKNIVHPFVRRNIAYTLKDLLDGPEGRDQNELLGELLRSVGHRLRYIPLSAGGNVVRKHRKL